MTAKETGFPNGLKVGPDGVALDILPGMAASGILRVAANAASGETVVITPDTYRVAVVQTDSTKTTANGTVNNDAEYVQNFYMLAHGLIIGDLILIGTEMMLVIGVPDANHIHLRRGVSGTTIVAHADAVAIYTEATPGAGSIAVGLGVAVTPTVFTARLTADINNRGTASVRAINVDANTVLVYLANKAGVASPAAGNPASTINTTETLAGGGNAWDAATLTGGVPTHLPVLIKIVPIAAEVTKGEIRRVLPFAATIVRVLVKTTSTLADVVWDGVASISGEQLILDNTGSTDWATTSEIWVWLRGSVAP